MANPIESERVARETGDKPDQGKTRTDDAKERRPMTRADRSPMQRSLHLPVGQFRYEDHWLGPHASGEL